jgi:tetratricopeptide (TPR) repeat protein
MAIATISPWSLRLAACLLCLGILPSCYFTVQAQTTRPPVQVQRSSPITAQRSVLAPAAADSPGEAELDKAIKELELGHIDRARVDLYAAIALLKNNPNLKLSADAHYHMGVAEEKLGRKPQSRQAYEAARSLYQQAQLPMAESYAVRGMAGIAQSLGRIDEARSLYREAIRISEQSGGDQGLANAWFGLGELERLQGNLKDALVFLSTSHRIASQLPLEDKFQQGEVNALDSIGAVHLQMGNLKNAFQAYEKARVLHESLRDRLGLANTKLGLGNVMRLQGRADEARKHYEEANLLYLAEQFVLGQGNAQLDFGRLDSTLEGRADAARSAFNKARSLYASVDHPLGLANAHFGLAELDRKEKRFAEADKNYAAARQHYQTKQDRLGQANVLMGLGDMRKTQGEVDAAFKHYQDALTMYQNLKNYVGQGEVFGRLNVLNKLLPADYEKAYQVMVVASQSIAERGAAQFNLGNFANGIGHKTTLSASEKWAWYNRAVLHYDNALEIQPDLSAAHLNWGNTLRSQAELALSPDAPGGHNLAAARKLYQQAGTHYADKLKAKPNSYAATFNWGLTLAEEADATVDTDLPAARKLWQQMAQLYTRASILNPGDVDVVNHWGVALLHERNAIVGSAPQEAAQLLAQAKTRMLEHVNKSPEILAYNLACAYALEGNAGEAVKWLVKAEKAGADLSQSEILQDTDLNAIRTDSQFMLWFKGLKK